MKGEVNIPQLLQTTYARHYPCNDFEMQNSRITEEQVQELADIGISAVAAGDSRETDENIQNI